MNIKSLIIGDYGAAAVLITHGALLGKITFVQLYMLVTLEVIFYSLNYVVCIGLLGAVDLGGSMTIHMFGAFFGITCTFFFKNRKAIKDEFDQCSGTYNSHIFALIGTLFLFLYFPSFNSANAIGVA